jgi:hypothetical protein
MTNLQKQFQEEMNLSFDGIPINGVHLEYINWLENQVLALRIHNVSGISLLNQCLKEQEEIVNSPIRFNGIHINKLKQVFLKNGIDADELGF